MSAPALAANERSIAITRDGTRVMYVGDGGKHVYVRALDEPRSIGDFVTASGVFASPDGTFLGVADAGSIFKLPISGAAQTLLAKADGRSRGATWTDAERSSLRRLFRKPGSRWCRRLEDPPRF